MAAAAFLFATVPSDRRDAAPVPGRARSAPTGKALPPGLREVVSATVGAARPRFHVQRTKTGVKSTGGGLASTFTRSVSGAIFQVFQLADGTTQLVLQGGDFNVCKAFKPPTLPKAKAKAKPKTTKAKTAMKTTRQVSSAFAQTAPTVRGLWGNGHGSFQTKGRYAAATVRGTVYYVADRCDGTITRVETGIVSVHDDGLNRDVTVNAGQSYLAKAK